MTESGNREFDDPGRYEREKPTRVMPEDLRELGVYTLRIKMPPGNPVFAVEYLACILGVERDATGHNVYFLFYPTRGSNDMQGRGAHFNTAGFMAINNTGPQRFPEYGDEVEIGYVVGSIDELDVELAELVQASAELVATK